MSQVMALKDSRVPDSDIRSTLLEAVPVDLRETVLVRSKLETHPRKEILYYQSERNEKFFEIIRGRVKISKFTEDGRELIIEILKEGDCFGYIPLIDGGESESTATTLTDTSLLCINFREISDLMMRFPCISHNLLCDASKKLRHVYGQMETVFSGNVQKRIARLLLEMARQEGRYEDEILVFNIRLTHQELANLAGTSRETVTRALTQLKNDNYISVCRSRVSILRETAMDSFC